MEKQQVQSLTHREARPIRVGVIGIGFGQQAHVPAFRDHANCEVVALCASSYERARVVADRLGVPKAYGKWEQLVADPDIEVVSVATLPTLQPAIALAALSQGKPVFCEKPLAPTRKLAAEMLSAAQQSGLAHMVDFEFVAIEEWLRAKSIIDQGALGRLRHVAVSWHVETYAQRMGIKSWKTGDAAMGGGALNSFVAHVFHYVEWLLGRICKLSAQLCGPQNADDGCGETGAILYLELAGGVPVSVSVNCQAVLGSGHRVEIYGEEGALVLENPFSEPEAVFRLLHGTRQSNCLAPVEVWRPGQTPRDGRVVAVTRLVGRFINWVRTRVPSTPSFEEGYRTQCLLDLAREAYARGQCVEVASC